MFENIVDILTARLANEQGAVVAKVAELSLDGGTAFLCVVLTPPLTLEAGAKLQLFGAGQIAISIDGSDPKGMVINGFSGESLSGSIASGATVNLVKVFPPPLGTLDLVLGTGTLS